MCAQVKGAKSILAGKSIKARLSIVSKHNSIVARHAKRVAVPREDRDPQEHPNGTLVSEKISSKRIDFNSKVVCLVVARKMRSFAGISDARKPNLQFCSVQSAPSLKSLCSR